MTREDLTNKFLASKFNSYVLQLPTSYGKTRLALQKVNEWYINDCKILISVPFLTLISSWKDEIHKWGYDNMLPNITFTTYVSLPKYCDAKTKWSIWIADEMHHTSERCREALQFIKVEHVIGLSATIKRDILYYFKYRFKCEVFSVAVKDAIENDVLPDPKIILIPLKLNNTVATQIIEKRNKRKLGELVTIDYRDKWKYSTYAGPLRILCTQQQYYNDLSSLIDWYKQKGMSNAIMKNMWLHKAGERLKWLAKQKEEIIKSILGTLKDYRVLTFCQSIEQSETLGCPCVNSKVGTENLDRFNAKKIKHISTVAMLDEGCNLSDCKIGLFQMINASQRIVIQRIGRLMRHKSPVLIFPYYINTREQEIMTEILKDYNPKLLTTVQPTDINNIKQYL